MPFKFEKLYSNIQLIFCKHVADNVVASKYFYFNVRATEMNKTRNIVSRMC